MRKVYIDVNVRLVLNVDETKSIDNVLSEMDYEFTPDAEFADVVDSEIINWNIVDSK